MKSKILTKQEIYSNLSEENKAQARRYVEKASHVTLEELTIEQFNSLKWHAIDASRILTPSGECRRLESVAKRAIALGGLEKVAALSKRDWFNWCVQVYDNFAYKQMECLILRQESEEWAICDGNHRSLVLAIKLLKGEMQYSPVKAFVVNV